MQTDQPVVNFYHLYTMADGSEIQSLEGTKTTFSEITANKEEIVTTDPKYVHQICKDRNASIVYLDVGSYDLNEEKSTVVMRCTFSVEGLLKAPDSLFVKLTENLVDIYALEDHLNFY